MLLLGIWNEKYSLRYVPITLMQVAYCAGTAFVLSAVQATSGPRLGRVALSSALTNAEQCIRYLLISGQSFECANHVASILSNLLHDQLRPRLLMRTLEPKDLVTSNSGQDRDHNEYQYPPPTDGSLTAVATENADCFSLASTISSLDALRDQCRNTAAAHSYSPDWNPQEGFPLAGLAQLQPQPASSSSAAGTNAGYNNGQFQLDFSQLSRMPEDVEMEWGGLGVGMDLGIMGGQPLSNRPYMAFDIPELTAAAVRVGPDATYADIDAPPFDPQMLRQPAPAAPPARTPQSATAALAQGMQLDFNQDELAVMDQLMRQQLAQNMAFQAARYDGMS